MRTYLLRKLVYFCLSLWCAATLTFCLMKLIPGDPFQQEQALPTSIYQALKAHYGLNDPLAHQYVRYLKQIITLDFGPSFIHPDKTATAIIKESLPISMLIGAQALIIALPSGILLGTWAALKQKKWPDTLVLLFAIIGISIPSFIMATILQYLFAIQWHLLPIARLGSFAHTILPTLSLSALPTAFIAKMVRSKMSEELKQDYITMARAKGLPPFVIIFKHAMRNTLIPVINYLGPLTAHIMTGSFIVEKIYSIPGLGYWFVMSVLGRDYTLIMSITVFYCALLLLATLIADLICMAIDPRIALSLQKKAIT